MRKFLVTLKAIESKKKKTTKLDKLDIVQRIWTASNAQPEWVVLFLHAMICELLVMHYKPKQRKKSRFFFCWVAQLFYVTKKLVVACHSFQCTEIGKAMRNRTVQQVLSTSVWKKTWTKPTLPVLSNIYAEIQKRFIFRCHLRNPLVGKHNNNGCASIRTVSHAKHRVSLVSVPSNSSCTNDRASALPPSAPQICKRCGQKRWQSYSSFPAVWPCPKSRWGESLKILAHPAVHPDWTFRWRFVVAW